MSELFCRDVLNRDVRGAGRVFDGFSADNLEPEFAEQIAQLLPGQVVAGKPAVDIALESSRDFVRWRRL